MERGEGRASSGSGIYSWLTWPTIPSPTLKDRTFTFGYGARALSLRDRLLAMPNTNLASMDLWSFSPGVYVYHLVDTYRRDDMPDAFTNVPPLPPSDKNPASALDPTPMLPPSKTSDLPL